MENTLEMEKNKISQVFTKCFINNNNELILDPKYNIYFRLEDVKTTLDFKCKVIEWCARHASKGLPKKAQENIAIKLSRYLGYYPIEQEEKELVYTYLGNGVNRKLCEAFVNSNYDVSVIKEYERSKRKSVTRVIRR